MAQSVGIIDIVWNGRKIPVEKGAKYKPGGLKANRVVQGRQVHHAYEFKEGEATGTTALLRGQRFTELYAPGPGTLQVLLDTGQCYTHPDAVLEETPEMTGGEGGKIELKFFFGAPEEIL